MADVGNLVAKLTLDSTEFSGAVDGIGEKLGSLASGIGSTLGGVTAAVGAAVGAAAAGVASLVKSSVQNFAEYEQLVGGVETLFKDSADTVKEYANQAFQTAGMSANQYMSTVTSFSASMIQSLGGDTQAAADLSNQAIIDMSDNANKMGTDITAIQNAYAGFAKQNYTMLDNLKLGYGGTQAEMDRLIADAEKLDSTFKVHHETVIKNKEAVDEMSYSFADIAKAIHIVQDNLGITGTTAKEASETISGSFNTMKAAWQNVLTSIAGGGPELSETLDQLVESAKAFGKNIIPVVSQALKGVAELIKELAPIISAELPGLIQEVVPMLLEAAMSIVQSLTQSLPELIEAIMQTLHDILPQIAETVVSLLDILVGTILPALMDLGGELILSLAEAILNNMDSLQESAMAVIMGLIGFLTEYLPELITIAVQIVTSLATFISENLPIIIPAVIMLIMTIMQTIIENLPTLIMAGLTILNAILDGIAQNFALIVNTVIKMILLLITTIIEHLPEILAAAIEIGLKIVAGIAFAIPSLLLEVGRMLGIVKDTQSHVDKSAQTMQNNTQTMSNGVSSNLDTMVSNLQSKANSATSTMSSTSNSVYKFTDDMNKKADDLVKTTDDVRQKATYSFRGVCDVISLTRIDMKVALGEMADMIKALEYQLEELSMTKARPEVDPSGVEEGCNAIIESVEEAIAALNRLGAASAGGGGGGGGGGGRASGGYVSAGTTYLVGELGPELITPTRSGYVHTAEETADMLGGDGRTIVININGDVYDDQWSMRNKMRTAILDVIETELAYG